MQAVQHFQRVFTDVVTAQVMFVAGDDRQDVFTIRSVFFIAPQAGYRVDQFG